MRVNIQAKVDGISMLLTYFGGKLQHAVTRGDGTIGDEITPNAIHMQAIPKTIPIMHPTYIRGEVVMYEETFQAVYYPQMNTDGTHRYKNARNNTSGLCKGHTDPKDLNNLHFVAYDLHGPSRCTTLTTETEILDWLKTNGFETPAITATHNNLESAVALYTEYDQGGLREKLPYKTDGLVIKLDDCKLQNEYPEVSGRPGYATAIKPSPKVAITKIIGLVWEQGLSGRFTPVALVEPCDLDGTTNKRINMFNVDFLETWVHGGYLKAQDKTVKGGFGIGATVAVRRTGDVLPYLDDVIIPAS